MAGREYTVCGLSRFFQWVILLLWSCSSCEVKSFIYTTSDNTLGVCVLVIFVVRCAFGKLRGGRTHSVGLFWPKRSFCFCDAGSLFAHNCAVVVLFGRCMCIESSTGRYVVYLVPVYVLNYGRDSLFSRWKHYWYLYAGTFGRTR